MPCNHWEVEIFENPDGVQFAVCARCHPPRVWRIVITVKREKNSDAPA